MEINNNYDDVFSAAKLIQGRLAQSIQQSLQMADRFSETVDILARYASALSSTEFLDSCNDWSGTILPALKGFAAAATMSSPLAEQFSATVEAFASVVCTPVEDQSMLFQLDTVTSACLEALAVVKQEPDSKVVLPKEALESANNLSPFVPEEKRPEFEKIVAPTAGKKILTGENIKWLIVLIVSIIMPLLVHYLDSLPSEAEMASIQFQEEFLDKFQELIDAVESQGNQPVEFIYESEGLCDQLQAPVDSVAPNEQENDTPGEYAD